MQVNQLPNNPPFSLWFGDGFRKCTSFGAMLPFQVIGLVGVYPNTFDCRPEDCECIEVFAEVGIPTDDLNNDANSFLFDFPSTTGDTYFLDKYTPGGWVNVDELDNTTGIKYPIGTWAEYPKRGGVYIEWNKVLALHGIGTYRLRLGNILPPPAPDVIMTSACFILRAWTCQVVDDSIVIEIFFRKSISNFLFNGNLPTPLFFDCTQVTTQQGKGWYDRNRYRGHIGHSQTKQKTETLISYQNGYNNVQYNVSIMTFKLELSRLGEDMKTRLVIYGLKADKALVTGSSYTNNQKPKTKWQTQFYKQLDVVMESDADAEYSYESDIPNYKINVQKRYNIQHRT